MTERRVVIFLGVVALILRLAYLGAEPLSFDESITLWFVTEWSWWRVLGELPVTQPHPPGYYLLLKAWLLVPWPDALLGARFLSALLGVASVIVLYACARDLYSQPTARVAALVWAISPFAIQHSQLARMYSLLPLAGILLAWTAWRLARAPSRHRAWAVAATSTLAAWTHVYGLFAVAGIGLWVAWRWHQEFDALAVVHRHYAALAAGVAGVYAPAMWIVAKVVIPQTGGTAQQVQHIDAAPSAADVTRAMFTSLGGRGEVAGGLLLAAAVAAWLLDRHRWWTLAWVGGPVGLATLASHLARPILLPRYVLVATPGLALLVGVGVAHLRWSDRWIAVALVALLLAVPLGVTYAAPEHPDIDSAVAYVDARDDGDAAVVIPPVDEKHPLVQRFRERGIVPARATDSALVFEDIPPEGTVWTVVTTASRAEYASVERYLDAELACARETRYHQVRVRRWVPERVAGDYLPRSNCGG